MEYRQHRKPSWGNHALHHARHTDKRKSKTNSIPCHQHRKRRHHTRLPMDGGLRTSILVEEWSYQRKGATHHPPVSKSSHPWKRPDNRTNKGRLSPARYNLYGTRYQSTTIHAKGGSSQRISTIRKNIL